jgi:hypothetical protein
MRRAVVGLGSVVLNVRNVALGFCQRGVKNEG